MLSHISAGFIAVLVGYTSSAAIVFQAARTAGADAAQIASWLLALGLGMGVTCIGLSLRYRSPILTAWSTPGAALLITALAGIPMDEAIGAFIFASGLILASGLSGWVEPLLRRIPKSLAAAMLGGILLRFGLEVFASLGRDFSLVAVMLAVYLLGRRVNSRYTVLLCFLAGLGWAAAHGQIHTDHLGFSFSSPVFVAPTFSVATLISVGIPLFVVTMTSQNLPGLAVLQANGYSVPAAPLMRWTGLAGVLLAPLGGFSFNLAAITAAICMSPEADPNPRQRYLAAVWAGVFYLFSGLFGASVVALFSALPGVLVSAGAGIALFGTIGNSLASALGDDKEREPALIAFLVTASGLSLAGVGSAFWGLVSGLIVLTIHARKERIHTK